MEDDQDAQPVTGDAKPVPMAPGGAQFLFPIFEEEPQLVEAVKAYAHNGRYSLNDPERCYAIVEAVLQGFGKKQVARVYHVGRQTINGIMQALEDAGKLDPLKQRVGKELLEVSQLATASFREALLDGKVPPQVAIVGAGIAAQRSAELMGSEGSGESVKETGSDREAWLEKFRAAKQATSATDAQEVVIEASSLEASTDSDRKPKETGGDQ